MGEQTCKLSVSTLCRHHAALKIAGSIVSTPARAAPGYGMRSAASSNLKIFVKVISDYTRSHLILIVSYRCINIDESGRNDVAAEQRVTGRQTSEFLVLTVQIVLLTALLFRLCCMSETKIEEDAVESYFSK